MEEKMLKKARGNGSLVLTFPSERSLLSTVLAEIKGYLQDLGLREVLKALVVARELLLNALQHGNAYNPGSEINVTLRTVGKSAIRLTVEDEGEGFDYRSLNFAIPDDPRTLDKRGYVLIHALAESLTFNDSGNRVTALLPFPSLSEPVELK